MGKGYNNYMTKKFFHPASKENIKRVWMAQQKTAFDKKKQEDLMEQYKKEQDQYGNRALLGDEKAKLGLNFLYDAPPGLKNKEKEKEDGEPEYKFEWQRKFNAPRETYAQGNETILDQPFGIEVRNVRCIKCRQWGHVNTDKICPLFGKNLTAEPEQPANSAASLLEGMQESGLTLKQNVMGRKVNPGAKNQQLLPSDDEDDPEVQFLKSLTLKEKKKLFKKLNRLQKESSDRSKHKRKKTHKKRTTDDSDRKQRKKKKSKKHRKPSASSSSEGDSSDASEPDAKGADQKLPRSVGKRPHSPDLTHRSTSKHGRMEGKRDISRDRRPSGRERDRTHRAPQDSYRNEGDRRRQYANDKSHAYPPNTQDHSEKSDRLTEKYKNSDHSRHRKRSESSSSEHPEAKHRSNNKNGKFKHKSRNDTDSNDEEIAQKKCRRSRDSSGSSDSSSDSSSSNDKSQRTKRVDHSSADRRRENRQHYERQPEGQSSYHRRNSDEHRRNSYPDDRRRSRERSRERH